MPRLEIAGASMQFEVQGTGSPVLALAPGGMASTIQRWSTSPINIPRQLADRFQVVAVDQRNSGGSRGDLAAADPWGSLARDYASLMETLGLERYHIAGMCIGASHALRIATEYPARVRSLILMQPIGLASGNRSLYLESANRWATKLLTDRPELRRAQVDAYTEAMWANGEFVFSVSKSQAQAVRAPSLILSGSDEAHPPGVSEELSGVLGPSCLVREWRSTPEAARAAASTVRQFLSAHD